MATKSEKARLSVELDGKAYELVHSPEAVMGLSMKYDGIAPLMAAISRLTP